MIYIKMNPGFYAALLTALFLYGDVCTACMNLGDPDPGTGGGSGSGSGSAPVSNGGSGSSSGVAAPTTDTAAQIAGLRPFLDGDFKSGGAGKLASYKSGATGKNVCPSDLNCPDFSSCKWANANSPPDQIGDWVTAKGTADSGHWNYITGTNTQPNNQYLIVPGQNANKDANVQFYSDPITCQSGSGTLTMDIWISAETKLDVCIRKPPSDTTLRNCQTVVTGKKYLPAASVTIPGNSSPFVIVLAARNFVHSEANGKGGLVAVDNINYQATDCSGNCGGSSSAPTDPTGSPATGSTSGGSDNNSKGGGGDPCQLAVCNFDSSSSPCVQSYKSGGNGNWKFATGKVGNPSTGIKGDSNSNGNGGYMYTDNKGQSVMQTQSFNLQQPGKLTFDIYKATAGTALYVCDGSSGSSQCSKDSAIWRHDGIDDKSRVWRPNTYEKFKFKEISLDKGNHQLTFLADHSQVPNSYTGIDNVNISPGSGSGNGGSGGGSLC